MDSQNGKVTLINMLKVDPSRQEALIALLKDNIDNVIRTMSGWMGTSLVAALDKSTVTIISHWRSVEYAGAMRTDPRMLAYFPKIRELAEFDSVLGMEVFDARVST